MDEAADTAAAAGAKRRADPNDDMKAEPPKKARTRTSPRAKLSWSALTPELLAKVATNLAVGPELVNFCSVVGKDVSRVAKQMYLYRNDKYFLTVLGNLEEEVVHFREQIYTWMDCNEGYWQVKCLGSKADANLYTVTVSKEDAESIKLYKHSFHLTARLYLLAEQRPINRCVDTSWILAINGVDVSNMSAREATGLLQSEAVCKDGKVRILCIDDLSQIFSHPCVACSVGLDRVVKYLIESGIVDPNTEYVESGATHATPDDNTERLVTTLQYSVLLLPATLPLFEYLVTVDSVDVNITVEDHSSLVHPRRHRQPRLHLPPARCPPPAMIPA